MLPKIKIKRSKLGRNKVWGFAHHDTNTIEIDSTLNSRKLFEIASHECLHLLFPEADEDKVEYSSIQLTKVLYDKLKFRQVIENHNIPLQDGSIK